jgi:hypothetical protein
MPPKSQKEIRDAFKESARLKKEMLDIASELEMIDQQIEMALARASWWGARATSGECKQRALYYGLAEGREYTDEEKVADAIKTAGRFLQTAEELIERKMTLLEKTKEWVD